MRDIKYIVVHCTATFQNATIEAIERYWKETLGWRNPGYHFIIKPDGEIVNIHPIEQIANGVAGYNSKAIHLSYIGGHSFDDRTPAQKESILKLLLKLKMLFPDAEIKGHRDFPNVYKKCPQYDVKKDLEI